MATAAGRYYAKHREELLVKMRERDALRREERRVAMEGNPELLEEERERYRKKYYSRVANRNKEMIDLWLKDETITDGFKTFLRESLLKGDAYKHLTPKMMNALAELPMRKTDPPSSPSTE